MPGTTAPVAPAAANTNANAAAEEEFFGETKKPLNWGAILGALALLVAIAGLIYSAGKADKADTATAINGVKSTTESLDKQLNDPTKGLAPWAAKMNIEFNGGAIEVPGSDGKPKKIVVAGIKAEVKALPTKEEVDTIVDEKADALKKELKPGVDRANALYRALNVDENGNLGFDPDVLKKFAPKKFGTPDDENTGGASGNTGAATANTNGHH